MRRPARLAVVSVLGAGLSVCLSGCFRYVFEVRGDVASDGGTLGRWRMRPQGCSRDPQDGLPIGQPGTMLTFFWEDPAVHDPEAGPHRRTQAETPIRMVVWRDGKGYAATLDLVKLRGTQLDRTNCSELQLDAGDRKPEIAGGRATLAGHLRMDCRSKGSHVTADVSFQRCEY